MTEWWILKGGWWFSVSLHTSSKNDGDSGILLAGGCGWDMINTTGKVTKVIVLVYRDTPFLNYTSLKERVPIMHAHGVLDVKQ